MLLVIGFTTLLVLALVVGIGASSPADGRTRSRDVDRRMRYVRRYPLYVNSCDIERLLSAGGLADDDVRLVSEKAAEAGIKPFTLWLWLQIFDVRTLATAVAADLTHAELIDRLGTGDVSDLAELEVFAGLNGLASAATGARTAATHDARLLRPAPAPPTQRRVRRNGIAA